MKTNPQEFNQLKDKTFVLNIVVKKDDIQKEYQTALKQFQAEFETKGFRKGKAPLEVVEQQISKEKVIEDVASKLISKVYSEKVKEHNLKPIIQPQVDLKNPPVSFEKDWEIQLTSCELPELNLNEKYQDEVKKINTQKTEDENKKIDEILNILVKNSKVELPQILIDSDTQHHLTHLVDQANQVGLTVAEYLKNKDQTLDQYKDNLKKQVSKEWTINLAISKVADNQKIQIEEKEIKDIVSQNPQLASNINFVYYLLIQQKVFEYLKTL